MSAGGKSSRDNWQQVQVGAGVVEHKQVSRSRSGCEGTDGGKGEGKTAVVTVAAADADDDNDNVVVVTTLVSPHLLSQPITQSPCETHTAH